MENKEVLNSAIIQEFLADFEQSSTTELLEEGKEQQEIFQIAEARGIKLKDRICLAGFKTVYTFANKANLNKARLPKKELLKALPTLVGTPVDIDHQRNYVVGHYIDYRYIVKDESVVVYGVFYKANFEDEWENAQKLFKAGKLTTSYEIYSPKNKRKVLKDGTFELHSMEIGGGALLFKSKPAFADAKVLEIAKVHIEKETDNLVYASKYRCEDLIIHGEKICQKCGRCNLEVAEEKKEEPKIEAPKVEVKKTEEKVEVKEVVTPKVEEPKVEIKPVEEKKIETPKVEEKPVAPVTPIAPVVPEPIVIPKIKCANCKHEFDAPKVATSEIKCSECFAIINDKGDMLYPPQIIDFNISCPSCSSRNWRLLKKEEDSGEIKCLSCAKKYSIGFSKVKPNELLNMLQFLHIGHVSCKQCGHYIGYSGSSQVTVYNLNCIKCGLNFTYDIVKDGQVKKLSTITEIIEPIKASVSIDELNEMSEIPSKADELNIDKSAIKEEAKGEVKMEQNPVENIVEVASTPDAKSEVAEVKEVIAETVAPVVASEEAPKVEETKTEEAKVEEAPKAEPIVEAKAEEAPKVEEKVEESKIEETPKAEEPKTEEAKVEEKDEATIEGEKAGEEILAKVAEEIKNEEVAPVTEAKIETPVEAKTEEVVDSALPPEVVKLIKKYTEEDMPMKDAMKKAWKVFKTKRLAKKIKAMKKEKASIVKTLEEKIEFYKANAEEINKRRRELGDLSKGLSDEELLDNAKFSDAKLIQANLETSSVAGTKVTDEDNLNRYRKEVIEKAEGRVKRIS